MSQQKKLRRDFISTGLTVVQSFFFSYGYFFGIGESRP